MNWRQNGTIGLNSWWHVTFFGQSRDSASANHVTQFRPITWLLLVSALTGRGFVIWSLIFDRQWVRKCILVEMGFEDVFLTEHTWQNLPAYQCCVLRKVGLAWLQEMATWHQSTSGPGARLLGKTSFCLSLTSSQPYIVNKIAYPVSIIALRTTS